MELHRLLDIIKKKCCIRSIMRAVRNPVSGLVFPTLVVFCCFVGFVLGALNNNVDYNQSPNMEQFQYCLQKSQHPRLRECVGRVALSFLQRFEEKENYTLADGLVSSKEETISGRSLVNLLDTDPVDFRGILENAGAVFSQRSFEWHMDGLYPGLMLKIGPSADANSVAEFVVDPALSERQFSYQEPSTARILTKQYLLPFLLGLKFNLIALVPLLFAGICLLLKKSLFLAKLAIYVSSFLGIGGAAGILGGLGGIGASLGGIGAGLGGIGAGLGGGLGPGGLLGFGVGPHQIRGHAPAHDVSSAGGPGGYFPGKTTVFNEHYEAGADELYHAAPYKRSERKVHFDKPRELVGARISTTSTTAAADHFYDYENKKIIQDRVGKSFRNSGKLGPSAYDDDEEVVKKIFKPSEQTGWKVVDVRV